MIKPLITSRQQRLSPPRPSTSQSSVKYVDEFQREILFAAVYRATQFDLHEYLHGSMWPDTLLGVCRKHTRPHLSIPTLAAKIEENSDIAWEVIDALLIPHSEFFRGSHDTWRAAFAYLSQHRSNPLHILSLGCAHGQEAFSIALLALEAGCESVQIQGWDVNRKILSRLPGVQYHPTALKAVPPHYLGKYFSLVPDGHQLHYRPSEILRSVVSFHHQDILNDVAPHSSSFDVVLFNNVKMHLIDQSRVRADLQVSELLRPGGLYITDTKYPPVKPHLLGLTPTDTLGVWTKN